MFILWSFFIKVKYVTLIIVSLLYLFSCFANFVSYNCNRNHIKILSLFLSTTKYYQSTCLI